MKEIFQKKLDALLDEMEMYGFYVGMPDEPSDRVMVLSYDDDDEGKIAWTVEQRTGLISSSFSQ